MGFREVSMVQLTEVLRLWLLSNVTFEIADAQVHRFPPNNFDLVISRFGTMFFDDPVAAFVNLGRALRPAGRLVMMVWQSHEWDVAIHRSLEGAEGWVAVAPGGLDAFSLSDPKTVQGILDAAGFADVAFTDVHVPVYYGPDVAAALDWVRGFACLPQSRRVGERLVSQVQRRRMSWIRAGRGHPTGR